MNPTWPLPHATLDYLLAQMLDHPAARALLGDLDGQASFDGMWAVRVERAKRGCRRG